MKVLMITYRGLQWTTNPFFYFFKKYWPNQEIYYGAEENVAGELGYECNYLPLPQPDGSEISNENWVDAFIGCVEKIPDDYILYLHPDYWLYAPVDEETIKYALEYMKKDENIARMNIGYGYGYADKGSVIHEDGEIRVRDDLERKRGPRAMYPFSLTPAIWNKKILLDFCKTGAKWSSWSFEENGERFFYDNLHIKSLAIEPEPLKSSNVIYSRHNDTVEIQESQLEEVKGLIPADKKITLKGPDRKF